MEIEKLLEQLLAPRDCPENASTALQDAAGITLDRSNGSSSSSNCSWISESSCGCHSARSFHGKSSLVFYRQPILPPLVCGQSRSEMLAYKTKAVEKEQKRKEQSRGKLLSRVEAILSSVNCETTSSIAESQESSPRIPIASSTVCEDVEAKYVKHDVKDYETEDFWQLCSKECGKELRTTLQDSRVVVADQSEKHLSSSSDSESQMDRYRHSLQNLVQKCVDSDSTINSLGLNETSRCLTQSLMDSFQNSQSAKSSISSSSEGNLCESSNTIKPAKLSESPSMDMSFCEPQLPLTANEASEISSSCSDTDFMADQLVDSVLEQVKSELAVTASLKTKVTQCNSNHSAELFSNHATVEDEICTKQTETPENSHACNILESNKSDDTIEEFFEDDHASSDKATEQLKKVMENDMQPLNLSDCPHSDATEQNTTSNCEEISSKVSNKLEKQNEPKVSKPDQSSIGIQEVQKTASCIQVMEECEKQSSVLQSTSSLPAVPDSSVTDMNVAGQTPCRIRRSSYSLDAPSPLLLNSKDQHTFYSCDADDELSTNTFDCEDILHQQVKCHLQILSDSEETSISDRSFPSLASEKQHVQMKQKDKSKLTKHQKALELQHKKELQELQHEHNLMLMKIQHELTHKNASQDVLSLVGGDASKFSNIDLLHKLNSEPQCDNSTLKHSNDNEPMHKAWCKLSALVKGHLTRQVLGSHHVQSVMQTIRDTSRTILSIQTETIAADTNMHSLQDATLLDRLFQQLQASLFEFHEVFFDLSVQERMDMIRQSDSLSEKPLKNVHVTGQRLSSATLKSLHRKKLDKKKRSSESNLNRGNGAKQPSVKHNVKKVKSKISYIWKGTKNFD